MAKPNVPDLSSLINQQIQSQQVLRDPLCKASALHVSLECEILHYSQTIVHFYLWSISDLVERSRELNEQILNELLRQEIQATELV